LGVTHCLTAIIHPEVKIWETSFLFHLVSKIEYWREVPAVLLLLNNAILILRLVFSDSDRQITWKIIFCTVVHDIVGSSVLTFIDMTLLAPEIWRLWLDFWRICGPQPTLCISH
jgi:hypothetical protein